MGKIKDLYNKVYADFKKPKKSLLREWVEAIVVVGLAFFFIKTYVFGIYHVPTGSAEVNLLVGDRVIGNKMVYKFWSVPQRGDLVMFDDATFNYDCSSKFMFWWQKYIGFPIPLLGLPAGPDNVVKRLIGVPGDTVEGRLEDGKTVVYLNGTKLDEPYVNELPLIGLKKNVGLIPWDNIGPLKVPDFLRNHTRTVFYTYDPKLSYDKQPYYNMCENEVIIDPFSLQPLMRMPHSPTHSPYGRNVDEFGPFVVPEGKYWVMGDSRKNSVDGRFWGFLDEDRVQGRASFILYSVDSEEMFWFFEFFKRPIEFWTKYVRWGRTFKIL